MHLGEYLVSTNRKQYQSAYPIEIDEEIYLSLKGNYIMFLATFSILTFQYN